MLLSQLVENIRCIEPSIRAQLPGNDLQSLGKRLDERTAAVELVMGPGMQAQHYETSFIQDEVYVRKAGSIAIFELQLQQVCARVSSRSRKFSADSHLAIHLCAYVMCKVTVCAN